MLLKTNQRKIISYIIPPIITVGLCYVLYSGVDFQQIISDVRICNPLFIISFLCCNVMAMFCRAMRWKLQLHAIESMPLPGQMLRSIFGTYAVNLVFPRLGEIWRCSYIARISRKPFSGVFGTMVADRLSDTLMVLFICGVTFLMSQTALRRFLSEADISTDFLTSIPAFALYVIIVGFICYLIWGRGRFAETIREFVTKTWRGFTVIFTMPKRGQWLLLTVGIWGFYILSMWFSMLAYPPTAELLYFTGFQSVMVTFVFGSLAMAIPSNGGIGPWQFAIVLSLSTLFGLDSSQALTFATINLGATTLLNILLGLYTFIHISIRKN